MTTDIAPSPFTASTARRAWIMLIVITMLTTAGMTVVLPVLPFVVLRYVDEPAHLALWVGALETVNALCAFIAAPILGRLSDRFGRRPIIIIAAFGAVVGYLLFGIGGSIGMLLLGRIVQGTTAGDLPALFAYLADITPPEKRAQRFGLLGALSGIGMMIGPAVGGLLAAIDVDLPVFATAGFALVIALLSIVLLPESLRPANRVAHLDLHDLNPLTSFRVAFRRPALRSLLIGIVLVGIPFGFFVNNFSVLALDTVAWQPAQIGLLIASVGVVDIVIQGVLLGVLLPRLGERGVLVSGIVAQAIGLLALVILATVLAQPWVMIVGTLVLAAGQGAAQATMDGVLSNSVGDDEQGWIAGTAQSLNSAIGIIAPMLAGVLYASVAHAAPYAVGVVLMVAAVVVIRRAHITSAAADEQVDEHEDEQAQSRIAT